MITLTVPYLGNSSSAAVTTDPACYETLGPTLALLDEIGTKLYQDAHPSSIGAQLCCDPSCEPAPRY